MTEHELLDEAIDKAYQDAVQQAWNVLLDAFVQGDTLGVRADAEKKFRNALSLATLARTVARNINP